MNGENDALLRVSDVSGSAIKIPSPCMKFQGLENISIVSENPIKIEEFFELYLRLEGWLKTMPNVLVNKYGEIVGIKQ